MPNLSRYWPIYDIKDTEDARLEAILDFMKALFSPIIVCQQFVLSAHGTKVKQTACVCATASSRAPCLHSAEMRAKPQ